MNIRRVRTALVATIAATILQIATASFSSMGARPHYSESELLIEAEMIEVLDGQLYTAHGSCTVDAQLSIVCDSGLSISDRDGEPIAQKRLESTLRVLDIEAHDGRVYALVAQHGSYMEPTETILYSVGRSGAELQLEERARPPRNIGLSGLVSTQDQLYVQTSDGIYLLTGESLQADTQAEYVKWFDSEGGKSYFSMADGVYVRDSSTEQSPMKVVDGETTLVLAAPTGLFTVHPVKFLASSPEMYSPCAHRIQYRATSEQSAELVWTSPDLPFVKTLAVHENLLYAGTEKGLFVYEFSTDDVVLDRQYLPMAESSDDALLGEVWDIEFIGDEILVTVWHNGASGLRSLSPTSRPSLSLHTGAAHAQVQEDKFGISEADRGGGISWGSQIKQLVWANDWPPDQSNPFREVYLGPDVLGTWNTTHSPEGVSEESSFGTFNGPVSNGASDPMSDNLDAYWVSNNGGDLAIEQAYFNRHSWPTWFWIATAEHTDAVNHTYNLNQSALNGPGDHILHDTNGDDYIYCDDIAGYNPNFPVTTCDAMNYGGTNDGAYVNSLNTFLTFVASNPGKKWVLGTEHVLGFYYDVDPFMYAIFLKNMSNQIRAEDPTAKVYLKDIGNLFGSLECAHTPAYVSYCDILVANEPGTTSTRDGADYWFTVAQWFQTLLTTYEIEGHLDGFVSDAAMAAQDDYYCWDASSGSIQTRSWCTTHNNRTQFVVPYDGTAPAVSPGQWLEQRTRPFHIDQDDAYRGGYAWNAFTRYLGEAVQAPLFWLVDDHGNGTSVVQMFGMPAPVVNKAATYGAGGKTKYWRVDSTIPLTSDELCPPNPWRRYTNVITGVRAKSLGTAGVPSWDVSAGYTECVYRYGASGAMPGWEVYPASNDFDYVVYQGVATAHRDYKRDANGDTVPDPAPNRKDMWGPIPSGTNGNDGLGKGREDVVIMAGLMQQLAMRWARYVGFNSFNVTNWYARATHTPQDFSDGIVGDNNFELHTCFAAEHGLLDFDGGGSRTPSGDVFTNIAGVASPNYTWWPAVGTNWTPSTQASNCFATQQYHARPTQGFTPAWGQLPWNW